MARGKVQVRRIDNPVHRQVTFCKRRAGLLKKARELSVLCDADVGLIIFSSHGKLYELATRGTMKGMIEKYLDLSGGSQSEGGEVNKPQEAEQEISTLKQEIDLLQQGMRCIFAGGTENMTLEDLHVLERQLEMWIYNVRATKMQHMIQEIQLLRNKLRHEGVLKEANEILQEKIVEQSFVKIVEEQSGHFNVAQVMENGPCPLTIQDEIFQFKEVL